MEKIIYEYKVEKIIYYLDKDLEDSLNKLSEEGWELICAVEERHYFRRIKAKKLLED
jgi:hypothetical protein